MLTLESCSWSWIITHTEVRRRCKCVAYIYSLNVRFMKLWTCSGNNNNRNLTVIAFKEWKLAVQKVKVDDWMPVLPPTLTQNNQIKAWRGPDAFILSFWGIPKWLRQAWPCPAAPRGGGASAEPHTLHQGKKRTPLIPILYDLNGCRISFFSVSSANGAWWIAFHVRWQHSLLNGSDLVCFVSHTYAAQWKWNLVAADLCRPGRAPPSFVSISVGSQKAFLSQTVFSPHPTHPKNHLLSR